MYFILFVYDIINYCVFFVFSLKDDWKIFIVHHVERRTLQNGNKKLDTYYYFGCKNFESGCVCVTDNLSIQFFYFIFIHYPFVACHVFHQNHVHIVYFVFIFFISLFNQVT